MRFPRNCKAFRGQLDVAPWAGLFFVLMLFFLLKTSFFFVPGVLIELPAAAGMGLAGVTNDTVSVMVDRDVRLFYDHKQVDEAKLKKLLQERVRVSGPKLTLIVQADRRLDLQKLVDLRQLAAEAGIRHILLAGRPLLGEGHHSVR